MIIKLSRWRIPVFAVLSILAVALTGWTYSPLLFLLYVPIFLAALRYWPKVGLGIAILIAIVYCVGHERPQAPDPVADQFILSITLTFPAVAIFSILLSRYWQNRLNILRSKNRELSSLLDMSQMMDSAFDLDMTLNLILLNVRGIVNCQTCAIYLKDESNANLELKSSSSPDSRGVSLNPFLPIDEARSRDWSVSDSHKAFYASDLSRTTINSASGLLHLDRRVKSFVCLPLTSIEGFLGMLYIGFDMPNGLNNENVTRLEQLASRASFPLQRVVLQQGYQHLAFSDAKTGLDNFRQFEQNLVSETNRAERYGHRLSVILLDIDHFKDFNDTYGHPAGDALLAQLAVVLRNSLRGADKPARFGGEEFVILCPETGKEEAQVIAERIRCNVARTAFALMQEGARKGGRGMNANITVSLGFATFPQDAKTAKDLVGKADTALYAAKSAGRNIVRGDGDVGLPISIA